MTLTKRALAELLGTFWLVLGGCGAALLAATVPLVGIGYLGIALAFGLTVLTGAYALGAISGAHFNPAVTVGLAAAGRFPRNEILPYVGAQVGGGVIAALVLFLIASGAPGFDAHASGFAANGFGEHSPGEYNLASALLIETVMSFMFVVVILGVTDPRSVLKGFAPLAIGLTLTLIHLVTIPVTGTSVNPARSTGPALFAGAWALGQLWAFWVAPLVGAVLAGRVYPLLAGDTAEQPTATPRPIEVPLAPHEPVHGT